MFFMFLDWGSSYPKMRRPLVQLWRRAWRIRRATLAVAVLVIRDCQDRVLVLSSQQSSVDTLRLPSMELSAWDTIPEQVESHLAQFEPQLADVSQTCATSLVTVDGRLGSDGVTFLYSVTSTEDVSRPGHVWLETGAALERLIDVDREFLRLCMAHQHEARATP